ncbi:MAG: hypothetical protein DRQ62_02835 [Gammaproteobacteria bacterium]|nr:MAG: hypothetical protein DRQ62_02835 [Gammaproteobacteria bacterium]
MYNGFMILSHKMASFFILLIISSFVKAEENSLLTLQSALSIAVQDNPNLAQIQARSMALATIPSQVGTLPDPIISFTALNLPVQELQKRTELVK